MKKIYIYLEIIVFIFFPMGFLLFIFYNFENAIGIQYTCALHVYKQQKKDF